MSSASVFCDRRSCILDNALEAVGQTPMIRLNKVPKRHGIVCDVVAKCEFFNPGGSVKDRICKEMFLTAEKNCSLPKKSTFVEASSGNTGIGMSLCAAVLGHRMIVTMPDKMSAEKENTMKCLGAEVIRTPNVSHDHPDSLISVARRLEQEKGFVFLDQYKNEANPRSHYETTAVEIYEQCGGKVDMVVMGCGTGGTMTGVAKKLKELIPDVIVVGVDPVGSLLADPSKPPKNTKYEVEGIGYDFVPDVCHRQFVDRWIKSSDKESFQLARAVHREEGLLCGGSSGSALFGVLEAAKDLRPDQRCVVIFPDGIRNYMTKFLSDKWMRQKGFLETEKVEGFQNIFGNSVDGRLASDHHDTESFSATLWKMASKPPLHVTVALAVLVVASCSHLSRTKGTFLKCIADALGNIKHLSP